MLSPLDPFTLEPDKKADEREKIFDDVMVIQQISESRTRVKEGRGQNMMLTTNPQCGYQKLVTFFERCMAEDRAPNHLSVIMPTK